MVLRSGVLAFEWYAPGWDGRTVGRTMSVTKSVASLMVGQAIGDGRLGGVDAPLGDLVAGIADAGVARLTLARLLRMDCGIAYREGLIPWHDDARVYHGSRLRLRAPRVRLTDPVGRYFHYNDWHPLLVALALERAGGASVAGLLARDLWGPLGGGPASLSLDRRGASALGHLESGFNTSAYGLARFGQLVLQRGSWEGKALVPEAWMARLEICPTHGTRPSTSPTTLIGNCPGPVRWRAVATPTRTSGGTIVRRQARMICSRWAHSARMSTSPQTPTA
ncbi:MAG: serine hydrolase [Simplicispira sp.]|nr:serine hydrolase [Simplicispira sp.]